MKQIHIQIQVILWVNDLKQSENKAGWSDPVW